MLYFKTKKDASGNTYYLSLNIKENTFKIDYNIMLPPDAVVLASKKELSRLEETLEKQGYKRIL